VPAADARKAEDSSLDTLLTPRPPALTGKLAFVHWPLDNETLQILEMADRSSVSNLRQFNTLI
jgi:hypothetical protein